MSDNPIFLRFSQSLLEKRWATGALALLLLAISLVLAWQWERRENQTEMREVSAQARILAGSLSGAVAFDDRQTIEEYVGALQISQNIRAAGVYASDGRLLAGYKRKGEQLPLTITGPIQQLDGGELAISYPIREGSLDLGRVYLRSSIETFATRFSRYVAIGIVLVLAALLIALLGAANAAAVAANRRLQEQIAAREQAEEALRQAQKMEALGQLTGGVAHDFNNLLMAASSGLSLLDRAKDDERRARLKQGIQEALERGTRITEQLLAFSRRRPLQNEVIRIDEHIAKLTQLLEHSLRENISVDFSIPPDVWPIEVDVAQFDIAILNLAVNAKDAMPRGGKLCISARNLGSALDGADGVEIVVEDDGEGMAPDVLAKVFEPFFTTKEVGRGTGLGLSQVYGFARAAGGTAAIFSTPGVGTKVALVLPRCAALPAIAGSGPRAGDGSGKLVGVKALLVEDDEQLNSLIGDMMEEHGLQVVRAACASEGLRLAAETAPDVVLSDMVMPGGMDGLELARELRQRRPDLPIVLMTGFSDEAASAAEEGIPLLRKPFDGPAMLNILAAATEKAARLQARQ